MPDHEKRKRTPQNYAAMFEDFDDDFGLMTDEGGKESDNESNASEYSDNVDVDQMDEEESGLESLFGKVHISSHANPIIQSENFNGL